MVVLLGSLSDPPYCSIDRSSSSASRMYFAFASTTNPSTNGLRN